MKRAASHKPVFAPSPQTLAERGADALRQGRFKDATDIFKQLLREDPKPEWTQRLGDAYAGRARALAEKGMFKEAAIVLENTLTLGRTIREPLLYLSCQIRQNQPQKARRAALQAMARLPAAEGARLAEFAAALSLAAPAPAAADANPEGGEAWTELDRAAGAALQAWLQGEPEDEVDRLLGRIPLRSPFGAMRLILKGLITSHDAAKARALLAAIAAGSPFAGVRDAAEAALADDQHVLGQWCRLRPAQQQFVAEVRGMPRDRLGLLNQILDAERRGPAVLLSMLTRRGLPLPEDELRAACLNLLPAAPDRIAQFEQRFGPLAASDRNRVGALAAEARENWDHAMQCWRALVMEMERENTGESRLAQAVVLRHMADLARTYPDSAEDLEEPGEEPYPDPVAHYLKRSLQADPTDLTATLAFLDRCRSADNPKDWYSAAELAAVRFPGNPAALLHAVDAAVARDAFKKASGFARQLLSVDPINIPVRQRMIELQLALARKQIRSGRADLAAKSLDEASEWERADMPNPALRIARALVAVTAATDAEAAERARAAVAEAGGGTLGWFRVALEASLMNWPAKRLQLFQRELEAAYNSEPDRATVLALVGLLGQREVRDSRRSVAPAMRAFEPFLARGSRIDWSPAEFLTIAEMLAHLRNFHPLLLYATQALKRQAGNLAARFYQILARAEGKRERLNGVQESELFRIMEQALQRQDFAVFNRAQKLMFGLASGKAIHRVPGTGKASAEQLDGEDMAELLASVAGQMSGMPAREIRDIVNELGRKRAIEMMAATLSDSPMSDVLSEEQMLQLCAALVAQAMEERSGSARRR
jgi:cellulose synthase operon protein C